ncbi:MAG: HAD-IA family hydrolase [Bryobacteraceae bacterium]
MIDAKFYALFSDIGGVLGTNGWDASVRKKLTQHFRIDYEEIDARHHLMFDSYERGYMRFEDYLRHVFFASPRNFTVEEVRDFTYEQSVAWPENIEMLKRVKIANGLKLGLISNEGQGITEHRIRKFGLRDIADFLVISHFVHFRKPDREIWELALHLAQAKPSESIYIDDREMFVNAATEIGFTAIHHVSLENTRARFRELGLR